MAEKIQMNPMGFNPMEEFLLSCKIKNLRPRTISSYEYQIQIFHEFLKEKQKEIFSVTMDDIGMYILYLKEHRKCNDITINSYLRGLRAYLYFCMKKEYIKSFTITLPKADKPIKQTYTEEELLLLLKKPNVRSCDFSEFKIWALSSYLLGTGNRISTALSLTIGDIDFDNALITLSHTKNRKVSCIPLSTTLSSILKEYLKYRKGTPSDYIFCNSTGGKWNLRVCQEQVALYNHKRGVHKTSLHLYRHTFAKNFILNGGDIFRLQKILGHSDLSVVREYVQMFGKDLAKDFDDFNPLDNLTQKPDKKIRIQEKRDKK